MRVTEEWLKEYEAKRAAVKPCALLVTPSAAPAPAPAREERKGKYGARKAWRGPLSFDSQHEARCWDDLCLRRAAGDVLKLQRQVRFPFTVDGRLVGAYRADFVYRTNDGVLHVADAKSVITAKKEGWARTKKLFHACYGIEIEEM
jgi:Protein of unknown function (DUF1064)